MIQVMIIVARGEHITTLNKLDIRIITYGFYNYSISPINYVNKNEII